MEPLRPSLPDTFRRSPYRLTVERLLARTDELAAERQGLRERDASPATLERNRLQLAEAHWELAHALIERYRRPSARAA